MKRRLAILLSLTVLLVLSGCSRYNEVQDETEDKLFGTWQSSDEKINFSANQAEITGYYELDGQKMAGVVTLGEVEIKKDGSIEITIEGNKRVGYLKDDNTLILDGHEFLR